MVKKIISKEKFDEKLKGQILCKKEKYIKARPKQNEWPNWNTLNNSLTLFSEGIMSELNELFENYSCDWQMKNWHQ